MPMQIAAATTTFSRFLKRDPLFLILIDPYLNYFSSRTPKGLRAYFSLSKGRRNSKVLAITSSLLGSFCNSWQVSLNSITSLVEELTLPMKLRVTGLFTRNSFSASIASTGYRKLQRGWLDRARFAYSLALRGMSSKYSIILAIWPRDMKGMNLRFWRKILKTLLSLQTKCTGIFGFTTNS